MDILAMLGITVAIILILIGLYMIFQSKPDSSPVSMRDSSPLLPLDSLSDLSSDSSYKPSNINSSTNHAVPELKPLSAKKPELVQMSAVLSANEFITQTIKRYSDQNTQTHPVVDEPLLSGSEGDSDLEHETQQDSFSNDLQLPLLLESTSADDDTNQSDETNQFDHVDKQNHNRLDEMLDDLAQATNLFAASPHDVMSDLNEIHDSLMTHAEIPTTDQNTVIGTTQLAAWEGESALINEHLAEHTRSEENSVLVQAEQIIAIHLLPKNSRPLEGRTVLRLLRKYGLRFGEMDLFHRFEETTGEGAVMFSVLKYTQEGPAGFDLDTMEQENFDGLSFFLALPGIKPLQGFDMMMSTAHRLGQECYAQLLDDEMNLLSEQLKGHYRHQVLDFRPTR